MAALVVRRTCTLIPRSLSYSLIPRSAISPPGSSPSLIHLHSRLFSSPTSANDHTTQIESILDKSLPYPHFRPQAPLLPIPDGFPFTIEKNRSKMVLTRQDTDEDIEVAVDLESCQLINGNPCYKMRANIYRGNCKMRIEAIVGPQTLIVQCLKISGDLNGHLRCFEEFLDSKLMDMSKIRRLFSLLEKN